jgi:hypothetical protein
LAKLEGMNWMSAMILLCQVNVEEILSMHPDQRIDEFGYLIGIDAVVCKFFFTLSFKLMGKVRIY